MKAFIRGISYYLPEQVLTNEELMKEFPEWDVEKVYNKVGVRERHISGPYETAGDLAEKAARKLFAEGKGSSRGSTSVWRDGRRAKTG